MTDRLPNATPILPVADLARALAFYERLGFAVGATYPGYALLSYGPTELHLAEVPEIAGQDSWCGVYLRVTDVDAVHAHWTAVGARELSAPADQPYGIREFATEDLDGNLWRVGAPLAGDGSGADIDLGPFGATSVVAHGEPADPAGPEVPSAAGSLPLDPNEAPPAAARAEDEADAALAPAPASAGAGTPTDGRPGTDLDAWFPLVAESSVCAGCGLVSGELQARAIGAEVRDLAHALGNLLIDAADDAVRRRPDPQSWSALEYGVHVRDLLTVFSERIIRTLAEHNPELGWWDHEAAIADGMANESDVGAVADDLGRNASKLSEALRLVTEDDWDRPATRRDGERFTIELLARFTLHEVVHHTADARAALTASAG